MGYSNNELLMIKVAKLETVCTNQCSRNKI